jgi:hypothetical protein
MLVPLATAWVPTAIVVGMAGAVLALMIWSLSRGTGPDGTDDPGSDGGGGWWRQRHPRRPPPVGPVSWTEFERQFAAYVDACREGAAGRSTPRARRDRQAPVR